MYDLNDLMWMFGVSREIQDSLVDSDPNTITDGSFIGTMFERKSEILDHPVFNS